MRLEEIALTDPYFIERSLYPNVDFYSGIIPQGDRHSNQHVHCNLRPGPHRGLDLPLERNALQPVQDSAVRASCTPATSRVTSPSWKIAK